MVSSYGSHFFALKKQNNNYALKAFLYGLFISFIIFLPFLFVDNGHFLYYGDFNVQQIPFYQMCHDAVRSGNIRWSPTTDLGANFIGSYTFYLIGSPFFWLTLPFPSKVVPYLMAPLLMLKFACASLTASLYLQRYVKDNDYAVIGGIIYAFSGFSIYNVFFNHFHEAIVLFPLLLASLDEYMETRRRGVFAIMVFACCFVNYYFFVGQVVFCIIYWFVRMFAGSWHISSKDFFLLVLEAIIGVGLSCLLLVPTILAVIQNPRVNDPPHGWNALLYSHNQRYLHIIECFFFPPDIPARPNFTPNSEAKWASLGAWLPLFSMTGVIAWIQCKRRHWLRRLLIILYFMALVPILNSSFQLFNSCYYARWFYMITLMMTLATILSIESEKINWGRAIRWTLGLTLAISLPIGLMPNSYTENGKSKPSFGLEQYPTRFWSYVSIALVSLLLLSLAFRFYQRDRQQFKHVVSSSLIFICVIYSVFVLSLGKTQAEDAHEHLIPYALNGGKDVHLPGLKNSRSDFYKSLDNSAMYWQIPSIQAFHSIIPGSVMNFYPTIGVTRDVGSRPDTSHYGLRALTSCRWLFDDDHDNEQFGGSDKRSPAMPGWKYYGNQNGFDVWQNQYYVPMGFSYEHYITRSQYDQTPEADRDLLLLKGMILSSKQAKKYSDIITPLTNVDSISYSENGYFKDCKTLQKNACSSFHYNRKGFSAVSTSSKDRLVFFSVPYEKGWSAYVNGKPAAVENVSIGFMAVRVPAGTCNIRFVYTTPGLKSGALISVCSLIIFLLYRYFIRKSDSRHHIHLAKAALHNTLHVNSFSAYQKHTGASFSKGSIPSHFGPANSQNSKEDL